MGSIPQGNFICYTRSSNGLSYRINPNEMSNTSISIPYNSKTNRSQLFTLRASLQYTVGNSAGAETLANIKLKAPQSYYSQNRMVNGQDYNSFPFTQYSNILQIKAVNRTSSGVSRYLDVIDPTGKYSSTNAFCDDGYIYLDSSIVTNNYSYTNLNTLASIIETQITNIIASSSILNFIYNNYPQFQQPAITTNQWQVKKKSLCAKNMTRKNGGAEGKMQVPADLEKMYAHYLDLSSKDIEKVQVSP